MITILFQSVKSIEERTRPNLCKTLKGNKKQHSPSLFPVCPKWPVADIHDNIRVILHDFSSDAELGLSDGQELAVADVTTPQTVLFKLNFTTWTFITALMSDWLHLNGNWVLYHKVTVMLQQHIWCNNVNKMSKVPLLG